MNLPKIVAIQCYQAVRFQGTLQTFFANNKSKKMTDVEMAPLEIGVKISTAKDCIIVPYANIAALYPEGRPGNEADASNSMLTREGTAKDVVIDAEIKDKQALEDQAKIKLDAELDAIAAREAKADADKLRQANRESEYEAEYEQKDGDE